LTSDTATFMKNAKKSRLQEVSLTNDATYLSQWYILLLLIWCLRVYQRHI